MTVRRTPSVKAQAAAARSPLTPGTAAARAQRPRALLAVLLLVLVLGHLVPTIASGVAPLGADWNALVARWASPLWRIWDLVTVLVGAAYVGVLVRSGLGRGTTRGRAVGGAILTTLLAAAAIFCILTLGSDYR